MGPFDVCCTGAPDPPALMESSNTSDLSVVVTWSIPLDIDIDHYHIEYRVKVPQLDWTPIMADAIRTSYEITDLSPSTTYEVRIFAVSTEGVSSVAANAISITTEGMYVCVYIYIYMHIYMYIIT